MNRIVLGASLVALVSCGYSTGSMMPAGVRSIAVGIFQNDTLYRQAEITYARDLTRELVRRSFADVRDAGSADAVLSGRIRRIPRITLVEDDDDRILEGAVLVEIEVHLDDALTGEPIIPPFTVIRRGEYITPRGETLQQAVDEALGEAARDTVVRIQAHSFAPAR